MAIKDICDRALCTGCSTCSLVCPKSAISLKENSEGFLYPLVSDNCIECGLCIKKCPINNKPVVNEATFYMGWHKDKNILLSSSSGGIFTAVAQYVFQKGGVVFGAKKDINNVIVHDFAESIQELEPLKLSKYYQSHVGDSYRHVKRFLDENRLVLFTGTACQIAGLKNFLGIQYNNLITIDVLCHGVASKKVVDAYLESKEKQFHKRIIDYHFRVKEENRGWFNGGGTRMHLFFEDGSTATEPSQYDTFFLGFNNNYFLRESCYNCTFCGTNRISDFTLADYWRCDEKEITDAQKKMGVSLILANSVVGKSLIDEIKDYVVLYEIEGTNAILHNRALVEPQNKPQIRTVFFNELEKHEYDSIIHSQFKKRFRRRIIKKILGVFISKYKNS